jgi:hypothetical protein
MHPDPRPSAGSREIPRFIKVSITPDFGIEVEVKRCCTRGSINAANADPDADTDPDPDF